MLNVLSTSSPTNTSLPAPNLFLQIGRNRKAGGAVNDFFALIDGTLLFRPKGKADALTFESFKPSRKARNVTKCRCDGARERRKRRSNYASLTVLGLVPGFRVK